MNTDPPTPADFISFLIHHNQDDSVEIKRELKDGDIQDIGTFPNLESAENMVHAIVESEHSVIH